MDPLQLAALVVIGLAAGVLSGLFGVGGAVVTTPALRAVGIAPILAVGSTIPAILPASVTGALRYRRDGLVDLRVGLLCGAVGSALAVVGALVSAAVDARLLMIATAGLLAWTGATSIVRARRAERAGPDEPPCPADAAPAPASAIHLAAVGAAAGFLAGLLGIGGGIVMVPLFTNVLRLPVKVATGSSLVAVSVFSATALASHTLLGHVDWPAALALTVGTVPGARIGAATAIGASDRTMRLALGAFFLVIALVFAGGELRSLLV